MTDMTGLRRPPEAHRATPNTVTATQGVAGQFNTHCQSQSPTATPAFVCIPAVLRSRGPRSCGPGN